MAGDQQHSTRVDLVEAKILITKNIGAQRAEKYFNLLSSFFSKRLNKSEFNKLCIVAVGRENIGLHNWFIKSIIKNACLSTAPPPKASKPNVSASGKVANGYQISCLQSLYRDSLLQSPRKGRTRAFRDGKYGDRPSPLGPHGKPLALTCGESAPKVLEQQSATELHSLPSRPIEVISVEDGEEVVQSAGSPGIHNWKNLTAPFGVQIRAKATPNVFSALPSSFGPVETCYSNGELPDTISFRKRLEQKLEAEGVKVSLDYANLLNASLDVYLKRMIKPCLELASSGAATKQNEEVRFHTVPSMNGMQPVRFVQRPTSYTCASLVDLRAAMEFDAPLLGEDRPLQLETMALQQDCWQVAGGSETGCWDGEINSGGFLITNSLLQNSSDRVYK